MYRDNIIINSLTTKERLVETSCQMNLSINKKKPKRSWREGSWSLARNYFKGT
jgi:hypothetical protein